MSYVLEKSFCYIILWPVAEKDRLRNFFVQIVFLSFTVPDLHYRSFALK